MLLFNADLGDLGSCEEAVGDRFKIMRAIPVKANDALRINAIADPRTPGETLSVTGDRFDDDTSRETGEARQLLLDPVGLYPALCGEGEVLVVAAAAAPRSRKFAGGSDSVGGGLHDLDRVRSQIVAGDLSDPSPHKLSLDRMTDEDDTSIGCSGDEASTGADPPDAEFDHLTEAKVLLRAGSRIGPHILLRLH
jgi:hypothetical protein